MPVGNDDLHTQYDVVPFSFAEFSAMSELFKSAFKTNINQANLRKRFDTSALGADVIGYIAIHKETKTPAAYYGVFPVKLIIDGKLVLAAQSGDTMTHENHRKRGLFIWLAEMTFEACKKKNIAFLFGQPNKNSFRGLMRLNWLYLDNINAYDLKLKFKTVPLAKAALRLNFFPTYLKFARFLLRKRSVQSIEDFHNPLEGNYGKVFRNHDYIKYKDAKNKVFIKVNNVILWVCLSDVFWIGDISDYGGIL